MVSIEGQYGVSTQKLRRELDFLVRDQEKNENDGFVSETNQIQRKQQSIDSIDVVGTGHIDLGSKNLPERRASRAQNLSVSQTQGRETIRVLH